VPSLLRSLTQVGSATLLSRVLGFVRDMVIARAFGADAATDAFFAAFKVPNLLRRLFAEGAFSAGFVPVLNDYRHNRGAAELKRFVDDVAGTLALALLAITALGILAAPWLVLAVAPGFVDDPAQRLLTADLLRLVLPYLFFIGLAAFAGGILNTHERFGVPAVTPVLLNLVLIGCTLWLAPRMQQPVMALAWGVALAGLAQLVFQLPFLARLGLLPRPRLAPRDPGVRRIARLMLPALFGVSVAQLSLLIDTVLASFLASGSISWLYYSDRLMEFPLGILGAAIGTVIMPRLAQRHLEHAPDAFSRTLDWGLRWVLVLGLPAAVGLLVLAGPVLATLFQSGAFTDADVRMAESSLRGYAFGLLGFMAIKVLVPGFYSREDTRSPVRIAALAMGLNLVLSLALMAPFAHGGLAFATALGALANAALLLAVLLRRRVLVPRPGWSALLARAILASLGMGLGLWLLAGPPGDWLHMPHAARIWRLALLIAGAGGGYGLALLVLGLRPRHLLESAAAGS
jgi:putative peptidoglycan lipid II flippase